MLKFRARVWGLGPTSASVAPKYGYTLRTLPHICKLAPSLLDTYQGLKGIWGLRVLRVSGFRAIRL